MNSEMCPDVGLFLSFPESKSVILDIGAPVFAIFILSLYNAISPTASLLSSPRFTYRQYLYIPIESGIIISPARSAGSVTLDISVLRVYYFPMRKGILSEKPSRISIGLTSKLQSLT